MELVEPAEEAQPERRRRPIRRLMHIVSQVLLALTASIVLLLAFGPRIFPYQAFYIRSGSMRPTLPIGSLAIATRSGTFQPRR